MYYYVQRKSPTPRQGWFYKIDPVQIVGISVCVCVSAPEAINNWWHDVA